MVCDHWWLCPFLQAGILPAADDPSGILNPGKTFIQGFSSLIIFLKAGDKHPTVIFNIYTVILHLVTILKAQHGWGNEFANTIGTHQ